MIAKFLLVLGGLNYLTMATIGTNMLGWLRYPLLARTVSLLIGLSALLLIFNRDYYLSFLGPAVMPPRISEQKGEDGTVYEIENLPPNRTVVYWAAVSGKGGVDPISAYADYTNSGITKSDPNGIAKVTVSCPQTYKVPKFGVFSRTLPQHFHYRYETDYPGVMSRVFTQDVTC